MALTLTEEQLSTIVSKINEKAKISSVYDKTEVDNKITTLTALAPSTLDTFKEIADQLVTDEGAVSALTSVVSNKVDKVSGKGLSTEDFTTAEKTKLASLEAGGSGQMLGSAAVKAVSFNSNTIAENLVVATGTNASAVGPISIASTGTITVSDGSRFVII